jgi:hypothetical protein
MKLCYTLTFLQNNANGGRDFRINSTIWLRNNGLGMSALSEAELNTLAIYIQTEIRTVWSSINNPGLSSGLGQIIYNSSHDTITCDPPVGGGGPRDTGVVVGRFANRAILSSFPIQGEILFDVSKLNSPRQRAFIDPRRQIGQLFYPNITAASIPPNQAYHNTAAHEFGHALGLADRYHYLANARAISSNADDDDNFLCRSDGGFPPMYLPGLFMPNHEYDTSDFNESLPFYLQPPYDRDPYNRLLADGNPHPLFRGAGNEPQPNYNGTVDGASPNVYDIEYNHGFTWIHNLMSSKRPVNITTLPVPVRNKHPFTVQNDSTSLLYQQMYSAEFANSLQVVPITKVQLDIVLDILNDPGVYITNRIYLSNRFECGLETGPPGMAESRGFSRRIFDQFLFLFGRANRGVCGFFVSESEDPHFLSRPFRTTNANQPFYLDADGKSNGTFIGIAYKQELDKDGNGGHVVSDIDFEIGQAELRDPDLIGYHGIHDLMSYRMSKFETADIIPNEWSLKVVKENDSVEKIIGFINPHLSAATYPTSISINDSISATYNTFFGLPDSTIVTPLLAETVLTYGGPFALFYINQMISLEINGGAFLNTALASDLLKDLRTNHSMEYLDTQDLYKNVGIADYNGRQIWNGISNYGLPLDFLPSITGSLGVTLAWDPNPNPEARRAILRANFTFASEAAQGKMKDYYQLSLASYINRRIIVNLVMP